ncbi:MAG: hypothetical protein RMJ53_09135, partial [Chitinophagales bacterium]|nr:hypothetical protein [Chitinophagales bacterium]MDW8274377.1 hypothetical protein [Chitinophagales bacterium]
TENNKTITTVPDEVKEVGLTLNILKINPESKTFTISVREKEKPLDFIIMKAIVFPYINLVWLGGILTFTGTLLSAYKRYKDLR